MSFVTLSALAPAAADGPLSDSADPFMPGEPGHFNATLEGVSGVFVSAAVPQGGADILGDFRIGGAPVFKSVTMEKWFTQLTEVEGASFHTTGDSGNLSLMDLPSAPMRVDMLEGGVLSLELTPPGAPAAGPNGSVRVLADGPTGLLWDTCTNESFVVGGARVSIGPVEFPCSVFFRARTGGDVIEAGLLERALAGGDAVLEGSLMGWVGQGPSTWVSYGSARGSLDGEGGSPRGVTFSLTSDQPGHFNRLVGLHVTVPEGSPGTNVLVYLNNATLLADEPVFQGGHEMQRIGIFEQAFVSREGEWPTGGFAQLQEGAITVVVFDLPGPGSYDLQAYVDGTDPDLGVFTRLRHVPFQAPAAPQPAWWVWPLLGVGGFVVSRRVWGKVRLRARVLWWKHRQR